jgi:hypothetical protein
LLLLVVLVAWTLPASFTGQGGTPPAPVPRPHPPAPAISQEPGSVAPENPNFPPDMVKKQKKELLKQNFEKMKSDADELVELSKALQADLDKSNENVLSLKVVDRAEKIEKLAKKIKEIARGY